MEVVITIATLDPGLVVVAAFVYGVGVRLAITVVMRHVRRKV